MNMQEPDSNRQDSDKLSPEERERRKQIEEIIAREKPGYVVDWSDAELSSAPPSVDRSAPDLECLKKKFFGDELHQRGQALLDRYYPGKKAIEVTENAKEGIINIKVSYGAAGDKLLIFKDGKPFAAQG